MARPEAAVTILIQQTQPEVSPTSQSLARWASTLWPWCVPPIHAHPARLRYLGGLAGGTIITTGFWKTPLTAPTRTSNPPPTQWIFPMVASRLFNLSTGILVVTVFETINGGAGSSAGVRERFVPLNRNTMLASLLLPDGGKVEFQAWLHTTPGGRYYYKYSATAIIDPHGLRTTLQWEVVGPTHLRRLAWVIEPAGRSLHLEYVTAAGPRISQVTASDGRRGELLLPGL